VQHGVAHAVANSLHDVFLVAGPIALAGMLVVLLLRERPLRAQTGAPSGPDRQGAAGPPSGEPQPSRA
jgi:hypothetical protein